MAIVLVVIALVLALPPLSQADGRYVAIGDSVASLSNSYVDRFGAWLQAEDGITDVRNLSALGGATSTGMLSAQLPPALALINDDTDTRVVTIDTGGNDFLQGTCGAATWNRQSCPFADNLASMLSQLRSALDADPGDEQLLVMGYYNPDSGRGTARERDIDLGLFGTDSRIDPAGYGQAFGMTDIIGWLACRYGAALVDAWPAFKAGGQALMGDAIHPNATGSDVLARLFEDPSKGSPTPSCAASTPFATTLPYAGDGMLRGSVEPRLAPARWWFEYGSTTGYGASSAPQQLPASAGARDVAIALPGGTRHARLVVENDVGRFAGSDQVIPLPPALQLSGPTKQRIGRSVFVRVTCPDGACTATATGTLRIGRTRLSIARVSRHIAQGAATKVVLTLSHKERGAAARALRRHTKVSAVITVSVRDASGRSATRHRTVRIVP
jgi:lysophospholipase L1-like esterase